MPFDLEKLLVDVFAPQRGDILTIMYDLPHGEIQDNEAWQARREMAESWRAALVEISDRHGLIINPIVTYLATGTHNGDLPEYGMFGEKKSPLEEIIKSSTIIISMPEYSASAPLIAFTQKYGPLRVASMPMATKSMEETGLSADYSKIAATCALLAPLFEQAIGIEVTFSTGHSCYFDISDKQTAFLDDGIMHPGARDYSLRFRNLPSGEVCLCPNEADDSRTAGEIPAVFGDETLVFVVEGNKIVDVRGEGPRSDEMRQKLDQEAALGNIAEVAIGCNDRAVVTGNVLEDEKAGFHWAYGRSDHLGGTVGPDDFSSPDRVYHKDIVYARGNPIVCQRLDFVYEDDTRRTAIVDGELKVEE